MTNFNAANSEMFRVKTFVTELFVLFHRGENKQTAEEIDLFPSLKLSKHEIVWKQHKTFWTELEMILKDKLSQKRSLHLKGELISWWPEI